MLNRPRRNATATLHPPRIGSSAYRVLENAAVSSVLRVCSQRVVPDDGRRAVHDPVRICRVEHLGFEGRVNIVGRVAAVACALRCCVAGKRKAKDGLKRLANGEMCGHGEGELIGLEFEKFWLDRAALQRSRLDWGPDS